MPSLKSIIDLTEICARNLTAVKKVEEFADTVERSRAELWLAAEAAGQETTEEERLRGGDGKIDACLFLEFLRPEPVQAAAASIGDGAGFPLPVRTAELGAAPFGAARRRLTGTPTRRP